jgi:hypothetical protein
MIQNNRANRPQSIAEVKRMLIGRGHDFIEQQKLDELKNRVIPTSEASDPLIDDPIRIEGTDWEGGTLILQLSRAPNTAWIMTLRNLRSYGSVNRAEPSTVSFDGAQARVPAPEHIVEIAYNHARNWVQQTNTDYAANQRRLLREREEKERRDLQAAIREAEESKAARTRVLEKLSRQSK